MTMGFASKNENITVMVLNHSANPQSFSIRLDGTTNAANFTGTPGTYKFSFSAGQNIQADFTNTTSGQLNSRIPANSSCVLVYSCNGTLLERWDASGSNDFVKHSSSPGTAAGITLTKYDDGRCLNSGFSAIEYTSPGSNYEWYKSPTTLPFQSSSGPFPHPVPNKADQLLPGAYITEISGGSMCAAITTLNVIHHKSAIVDAGPDQSFCASSYNTTIGNPSLPNPTQSSAQYTWGSGTAGCTAPGSNQINPSVSCNSSTQYIMNGVYTTCHISDAANVYISPANDIFIQDSPHDVGNEVNWQTEYQNNGVFFNSKDIWIRNHPAEKTGNNPPRYSFENEHENPEWTNTASYTPWIYVKLRNRGCSTLTGKVEIFWANASTAFGWGGPTSTTDQCYPINSTDPVPTISLGPGEEGVVALQWKNMVNGSPNVTNPIISGISKFCFVARFESTNSSTDPPGYEDISESPFSVPLSAFGSNNFAWKNVTLVNTDNSLSKAEALLVGNYSNNQVNTSIKFLVPKSELNSFLNEGGIKVKLGQQVYQKWISGGRRGTGVVDSAWVDRHLLPGGGAHFHQGPGTNEPYTIRIISDSASLENLTFDTSDVRLINTTFNYFNVLAGKPLFNYDIVQYNFDPGTDSEMLTGGERYDITYPTCYTITAGNDREVPPSCPTAFEVEPVIEGAKYIWRNNADGSYIDSTATITMALRDPITFEIEAIFPNGCIAYAWLSVNISTDRCSSLREFLDDRTDSESSGATEFKAYPNPFNDYVNIEYQLPENIEKADLIISDPIGRTIFTSEINHKENKIVFAPANLSPGIFICTIIASDGTKKTYKLVYMK